MSNIQLSPTEESLMKHLWACRKCFMKDLLEVLPEPKPAKTTVATLLRRMIDKGAVGYRTFGNSREYYPLIEKKKYFGRQVNGMIANFFNDSPLDFASMVTGNADLSEAQLRELQRMIDLRLEKEEQ